MEDVELLVHVAAPARRQDDQRFLDIAQSIIDFEPVTLTDGTDAQTSSPLETRHDSFLNDQFLSSSSRVDDDGNYSPTPGVASALRSMSRQKAAKLLKGKTDKPPWKASNENINPPYKNPYHGPPIAEKPRSLYETPRQSDRPSTAPEQLTTLVQVPRTGANLRRAYSDSASFSSLASYISNSQPSDRRELEGEGTSTAIPSSSWLRGGGVERHGGITRTLSQTSLDEVQLPHQRRKLFEDHEAGVKRVPRPANSEAFFLLDRSLDWTSSPRTSQLNSSSVSSTATPSQPLHDRDTNMEGPQSTPPPVILISSGSSKQVDSRSSQRAALPSSSEPHIFEPTSDASDMQTDIQLIDSRPSVFEVLGLESIVTAPQPSVSEERFATHITRPLRDFPDNLPFARFFRPTEVIRDIRVLERGYWLLEINLVTEATAEAARSAEKDKPQGQTMQERFQGATAAERLRKYDEAKRDGSLYQSGHSAELRAQGLWTEDELVQFWKNFSSFIEDGKAGWGIRLVGEDVSDGSGEAIKVRIRIFTWGEVLGHIYLAIWVLSNKLTARIPMHWVASDGSHVITMSGTRSGRGSLPSWTRKGTEGEKGCWGVASEA